MKNFIFVLCAIFAVFLSPSCGAYAAFDTKSHVVNDGLLYTVNAEGQKMRIEGAEVLEKETENGKIYWLAVDPEYDELYKGWEGGIYFFGSDGKFLSYLERENTRDFCVRFSPGGKWFLSFYNLSIEGEFILYQFDGLKLKETFDGLNELFWVDSKRFALMLLDNTHGERDRDAEIRDWISVAVYDVASGEYQMVKTATETEDYWLSSVDEGTGELIIKKTSVKNVEDWADAEKHESEEIRVPAPAAD